MMAAFRGLSLRWVLAAVFLTGLGLSWRGVGNPDLGFQLNAARYLLTHGDVPRAEPFLYTVPWSRYVNLQWLWQLGLYAANGAGGLVGMNLFCVGLTFAAAAVLLIRCRIWAGGIGAVAAGFLLFFFMVNFWDFRPHTVSWIYLGLVLLCLERHSLGERKAVWFLPLILLGWVNSHALFSLGLATIGLWTVGELLEACLAKGEPRARGFQKVSRLLGAGALSGFACLINPYGWEGCTFPLYQFAVLTSGHITKNTTFGINEFLFLWSRDLKFSNWGRLSLPLTTILLWMLLVGVAAGFLLRRPRWPGPVWLVGAAFLGLFLTAVKNWSYFAMALLPYAVAGWSQRLTPWRDRGGGLGRVGVIAASGTLLALMATGWWSRTTASLPAGLSYDPIHHAAGAAALIRKAGTEVRIMNPHDLGGWLAWSTGRKVYIDGRNDNYPEKLYREYVATALPDNFLAVLEVTRANVVVARTGLEAVWIETLAQEPDWRPVYRIPGLMVFFRQDVAPEIPALPGEQVGGRIPADPAAWKLELARQADKPLPGWIQATPFGQRAQDTSVAESAGSVFLGRPREAQAHAWEGICRHPHFVVELWVNLASAFEMGKEYPLADFCWDTLLRKVPDKDLQTRAEQARKRRHLPDLRSWNRELQKKGWR